MSPTSSTSASVRTCRFCDSTDTSPENWPQARGKPTGSKCYKCLLVYHTVQRHLNPMYKLRARLRKLIIREERFKVRYDEQWFIQMGRCASCEDPPPDGVLLVMDHDHSCCKDGCPKCFRGLLCVRCNAAAGLLLDDPARIRALADYVEHGGWDRIARAS